MAAILSVCLVALIVGLSLGLAAKSTNTNKDEDTNTDIATKRSTSGLLANFSVAAVAIDGKPCATGKKALL